MWFSLGILKGKKLNCQTCSTSHYHYEPFGRSFRGILENVGFSILLTRRSSKRRYLKADRRPLLHILCLLGNLETLWLPSRPQKRWPALVLFKPGNKIFIFPDSFVQTGLTFHNSIPSILSGLLVKFLTKVTKGSIFGFDYSMYYIVLLPPEVFKVLRLVLKEKNKW